jgi:hypothetical protein
MRVSESVGLSYRFLPTLAGFPPMGSSQPVALVWGFYELGTEPAPDELSVLQVRR